MATKSERLYRVVFDTQRNRRYITWGYFIEAKNQKEAKEAAFLHWNSTENPNYRTTSRPHMFHTDAARMEEADRNRPLRKFFIIDERHASWG